MFFNPEFKNGEQVLSKQNGLNADMLMSVSVFKMQAGDKKTFVSETDETAILIFSGEITLSYENRADTLKRESVFKAKPSALHVAKGVAVDVYAHEDSEFLIQRTANDRVFASKLYLPDDCIYAVSCEGLWENTARRSVVTVFDFQNAPYSNMVLGEIYPEQGRWCGYIPHSHPQPEIYYFKYERPEGFGACFIGDDVYKSKDGSCGCFPGGLTHPQVTAPGFPQYVCWMIRHLDGNPWVTRDDDPNYTWLVDGEIKYR